MVKQKGSYRNVTLAVPRIQKFPQAAILQNRRITGYVSSGFPNPRRPCRTRTPGIHTHVPGGDPINLPSGLLFPACDAGPEDAPAERCSKRKPVELRVPYVCARRHRRFEQFGGPFHADMSEHSPDGVRFPAHAGMGYAAPHPDRTTTPSPASRASVIRQRHFTPSGSSRSASVPVPDVAWPTKPQQLACEACGKLGDVPCWRKRAQGALRRGSRCPRAVPATADVHTQYVRPGTDGLRNVRTSSQRQAPGFVAAMMHVQPDGLVPNRSMTLLSSKEAQQRLDCAVADSSPFVKDGCRRPPTRICPPYRAPLGKKPHTCPNASSSKVFHDRRAELLPQTACAARDESSMARLDRGQLGLADPSRRTEHCNSARCAPQPDWNLAFR